MLEHSNSQIESLFSATELAIKQQDFLKAVLYYCMVIEKLSAKNT